jgi:putative transposase
MYYTSPRKSLRLPEYNYNMAGYYYITLCTQNRKCLLGNIKKGMMILNDAGYMVQKAWQDISKNYAGFKNDIFIVMPNHLHGILIIQNNQLGPAQGPAPTLSLPDVIRNFKSFTTTCYIKGVTENNFEPFEKKVWQRNYYEHIIRKPENLNKIREYISNNPEKWDEDRESPHYT